MIIPNGVHCIQSFKNKFILVSCLKNSSLTQRMPVPTQSSCFSLTAEKLMWNSFEMFPKLPISFSASMTVSDTFLVVC